MMKPLCPVDLVLVVLELFTKRGEPSRETRETKHFHFLASIGNPLHIIVSESFLTNSNSL